MNQQLTMKEPSLTQHIQRILYDEVDHTDKDDHHGPEPVFPFPGVFQVPDHRRGELGHDPRWFGLFRRVILFVRGFCLGCRAGRHGWQGDLAMHDREITLVDVPGSS